MSTIDTSGDFSAETSPEEWIAARRRTGNWIDLHPQEVIPRNLQGWDRTILSMFQLAFAPEIRRRIDEGNLTEKFFLFAAQLIQPYEGGRIVRLNEEVRGNAEVKSAGAFEPGESIQLSDFERYTAFDLDVSDLNSGHFTLLWSNVGWQAFFDFRSGRVRCSQFLKNAEEFLVAANSSIERGHQNAAVANLFTAAELVSKVELTLSHNKAAQAKSHGSIKSAINAWSKLGNVNREFVELFNKLTSARNSARYDPEVSTLNVTQKECETVRAEIEILRTSIRVED